METIHSWALGLCAAAVIGSAAALLTPSGALEKSVKTVIAVFIVCAVIMPFFKDDSLIIRNSSKIFDKAHEVGDSMSEEAGTQAEKYFKNTVSEILREKGITCEDIIIQIESEENTVNIKSVTVVSPDENADVVKNILKNEAGIDADVVM